MDVQCPAEGPRLRKRASLPERVAHVGLRDALHARRELQLGGPHHLGVDPADVTHDLDEILGCSPREQVASRQPAHPHLLPGDSGTLERPGQRAHRPSVRGGMVITASPRAPALPSLRDSPLVSRANDATGGNVARRALSTEHASQPVARYSQGIAAAGLVFTAGQGAHDPGNRSTAGRDRGADDAHAVRERRCDPPRRRRLARDGGEDHGLPRGQAGLCRDERGLRPAHAHNAGRSDDRAAGLGRGMLIEIDAIAIAGE